MHCYGCVYGVRRVCVLVCASMCGEAHTIHTRVALWFLCTHSIRLRLVLYTPRLWQRFSNSPVSSLFGEYQVFSVSSTKRLNSYIHLMAESGYWQISWHASLLDISKFGGLLPKWFTSSRWIKKILIQDFASLCRCPLERKLHEFWQGLYIMLRRYLN